MSDRVQLVQRSPEVVQCSHEGLVIHSHAYYTLNRGKRVYLQSPPREDEKCVNDSWFEFEADLYPPLMLMPATWRRYDYTVEDVHNTYEKVDASYMWQMALTLLCGVYEPEAVAAGIRPTFQSMFTFLFISRKNVFDALIERYAGYVSKKSGSVLCHERPDHRPLLPKVTVPDIVFNACKFMVPSEHPSFRRITTYDRLVPYKDVFMVPVSFDEAHNLVYMMRVVPKAVYDSIPVLPRPCVVTMPWLARADNQLYVMLEEACFFATDLPGHQVAAQGAVKKRKQPAKKSTPSIKKRKS